MYCDRRGKLFASVDLILAVFSHDWMLVVKSLNPVLIVSLSLVYTTWWKVSFLCQLITLIHSFARNTQLPSHAMPCHAMPCDGTSYLLHRLSRTISKNLRISCDSQCQITTQCFLGQSCLCTKTVRAMPSSSIC